ncbi:Ankyrin-3 like protein [Verticillium longisporum]|nr:Ankyrin-3 like protein [Verticillium longisporum]
MSWQANFSRIHGRPRFSKTILCSRIVEHLAATYVKFVAYFFLSSDHESRNDPYAVVRSWLSQLAAQPDVYDLIRPKWETTQDQVAPRATVVQLLRDVLQARPGCIPGVDDLDECTAPADSSSSITRFLEDVKNAITPATRVLRRHDDASAFSRSIVGRKLANKPEDVRASLSKTMTDRSDGQFLRLLLQEQSLKSWKTLVQLRRGLDRTPAGLNNLYARNWTMITRSDRADRAGALLWWAAFPLWPLTLGEITEAVLIEEEYEGIPTDELPDVIDDDYISSEIVELCGPLAEVRGPRPAAEARIVHLVHFTVREFLCVLIFMNEDGPCWGGWRNWVDTHDDDEVHAAEDEDVPPGPSYYALKFGLTALAVTHVQRSLYSGSRHGQSKMVRALLLRSARVDKMNQNGATPVNAAASNGLVKVVRFLVEKGADINLASNNAFTPANATAGNALRLTS